MDEHEDVGQPPRLLRPDGAPGGDFQFPVPPHGGLSPRLLGQQPGAAEPAATPQTRRRLALEERTARYTGQRRTPEAGRRHYEPVADLHFAGAPQPAAGAGAAAAAAELPAPALAGAAEGAHMFGAARAAPYGAPVAAAAAGGARHLTPMRLNPLFGIASPPEQGVEQKGASPPRQLPLRLLEQQLAFPAPGPLAPHNRPLQAPAPMVPPCLRLQPEQEAAGAAAAAVALLNQQGQQQQQQQELSMADMTRMFAQMQLHQEEMRRQMQMQQEQMQMQQQQLEQERTLRRQLEAQAQAQQEAEQRERERLAQEQRTEREAAAAAAAVAEEQRLAQAQQEAEQRERERLAQAQRTEREAAAAAAAVAEEQRLQLAAAEAAAREAAGARAAHEQPAVAGLAAAAANLPTPLLPSDSLMDLSTADPADIASFRFLTSGQAHKQALHYLSAVLAGQAYVPDSHGGKRAAGAAGAALTFKQDPHLRAFGGVLRDDGVVQLAKQLGRGSAEAGCSELPRHLLGMVAASPGGGDAGDGGAAAGGVAVHRPFSYFSMQPSRLGTNWQNHVSLTQHVMEAPRLTAPKFAALRERYPLAFAPGRTGPAFSTLQSALRDPAVGLRWVWAEMRACADGGIDFDALSWQALER